MLRMTEWNGAIHGDFGQAFERYSHQNDVADTASGARRVLVQIVQAWTLHNCDGVILTSGSGGVIRQIMAIEFYGPLRSPDGMPGVDSQFVFPESVARARRFFDSDDIVATLNCSQSAFGELVTHFMRHSCTRNLIDVRCGARVYEGIIAPLPRSSTMQTRTNRSHSDDATPIRSGNSTRRASDELNALKSSMLYKEAASFFSAAHGSPVKGWIAVLGCSYQAIALFRLTLGLMLVLELLLRYRFLRAFYSDEGTLPTRLLLDRVDVLYRSVCLHCHFGQLWQQQLLLTVQVAIALCFTLGIQTRAAAVASWYFYLSATLRNTWMSYILDRYFHYLLFLFMFLPVPRPGILDLTTQDSAWIVSPATVAMKLLVLWIYFDAGYGKLMDPLGGWSYGADPLPALDTYARHTLPAQYLYAMIGPAGLRLLTPLVVYSELLAAPVALLGAYFGYRTVTALAVSLICSLHVGIALTLRNSALLSFVACTAWCTFLPVGGTERARPHRREALVSMLCIGCMILGSLWLETMSQACDQSVQHIWSTFLHNRWNVFVGAEEYVTWEIAPGLLQDGSYVDVWGRRDTISWNLPGDGAPSTATARPGRWRSFPYLAELEGHESDALWRYLCREWDRENPSRKLIKFNFFMLQADVLPEMQFSETRKRLIKTFECVPRAADDPLPAGPEFVPETLGGDRATSEETIPESTFDESDDEGVDSPKETRTEL
jgi:hypothetical protein